MSLRVRVVLDFDPYDLEGMREMRDRMRRAVQCRPHLRGLVVNARRDQGLTIEWRGPAPEVAVGLRGVRVVGLDVLEATAHTATKARELAEAVGYRPRQVSVRTTLR